MITNSIISELESKRDEKFANWVSPILQITEGGYGEYDKLYGIRVPELRKLAKKYKTISYEEIQELLNNKYHETRMLALFILIDKFNHNKNAQENIVNLYIDNADNINNWDLVDCSAPKIIGQYVYENEQFLNIIYDLSNENHLWKQRIAIVSTQYLIKKGFYEPTIILAEKYLTHTHHLIHKATGWMLRELGKKDINELFSFLDKYHKIMPRVMLRYAIERLTEDDRNRYMTK